MLGLPRVVDAALPFLVFGTFFVFASWNYRRIRRMSRAEQTRRLRSSESQVGFPNAIMRAPGIGLLAMFLGALSGLAVLVVEYLDSRAVAWIAAACAVAWGLTTALTWCVAYTGRPRLLARRGLPEYDE